MSRQARLLCDPCLAPPGFALAVLLGHCSTGEALLLRRLLGLQGRSPGRRGIGEQWGCLHAEQHLRSVEEG